MYYASDPKLYFEKAFLLFTIHYLQKLLKF